jgi:acyl carrier protein
MTPPAESPRAPSQAEIHQWLIAHIAALASLPIDQVDIHTPIEQYGMDSIQAMQLCGELADWLGRPLAPTLVWEYPTVDLLAQYLSDSARA